MKIILISDSHGNKLGIDKLFKDVQFDYLFFMGDGLGDLDNYIYLDHVYAVSGNCDFFSRVENERYVELEGKKIFMTHGNKYGVKLGLTHLINRAKELEVDFVFYGHTHNMKVEKIDDIYFINPGKFSPNYDKESRGIILTIEEDNIRIEDLVII